jgi:2-isopropylmalate synthase
VSDEGYAAEHERFKLVSLKVCSETGETPHARLVIADEGQEKSAQGNGSGPVDATFKALESVVNSGADLLLYSVNNITSGTDAQGEVTVRLSKGGRIVNGQGADTDIVVASAKAYLHALNKLHSKLERAHPQV